MLLQLEKEPEKILVSSLNAPVIIAKNNSNVYFSSDISALLNSLINLPISKTMILVFKY